MCRNEGTGPPGVAGKGARRRSRRTCTASASSRSRMPGMRAVALGSGGQPQLPVTLGAGRPPDAPGSVRPGRPVRPGPRDAGPPQVQWEAPAPQEVSVVPPPGSWAVRSGGGCPVPGGSPPRPLDWWPEEWSGLMQWVLPVLMIFTSLLIVVGITRFARRRLK